MKLILVEVSGFYNRELRKKTIDIYGIVRMPIFQGLTLVKVWLEESNERGKLLFFRGEYNINGRGEEANKLWKPFTSIAIPHK